jgi:2-methylcitrate dehydratase PrpD
LPAAAVAGYEAITRLGRAIGGAALLYRGVWPTYVTAAFGAAATAAKLLDLDGSATARALALALSRTMAAPAGALARLGFRYYALGSAAADGADAAFAAAAGVEADLDGLASFAARLGAELDATELTAGLGERWRIQDVDTKPWPTSRQALASVAAFLELVPQLGALDDVERIEVRVPAAYRDMIDRPALPTQRIESMIGVQYQLGLAAFAPETLDDALRSTLPADARIAALIGKTQVLADGGLSAEFPRRWGSTVTLRRRSGRATTIEALEPALGGTEPPTWTALSAKLARIFAASGRPCAERLAALRARCERIGIADDAGIAAELLASTERLGERAEPRAS